VLVERDAALGGQVRGDPGVLGDPIPHRQQAGNGRCKRCESVGERVA
jgi:hypothetical protein